MFSFIKKYWASITWAVVLAFLMLLPQESFPQSELLGYDKLGHLGVFSILSFLILLGKNKSTDKKKIEKNDLIKTLIICIVYGVVLESFQSVVPGRMTDIYDLIANTIGAIVGVGVFSTFIKY